MLRLYRLYYLDSLSAAARSGRRQPTADQSVLRRERPIFRSGYPKAGIFDRCCDYGSLYGRRLSCKSKNRHSVWCFGGDKCRSHSISSVFPRNAAVSGVCPHYDSYFYATEKNALSYLLVYAEPLDTLLMLLILPPMLKLTGVWLAVPIAQVITFVIACVAKRRVDAKIWSSTMAG